MAINNVRLDRPTAFLQIAHQSFSYIESSIHESANYFRPYLILKFQMNAGTEHTPPRTPFEVWGNVKSLKLHSDLTTRISGVAHINVRPIIIAKESGPTYVGWMAIIAKYIAKVAILARVRINISGVPPEFSPIRNKIGDRESYITDMAGSVLLILASVLLKMVIMGEKMPLPKISHPLFNVEIPSSKKTVRFRPFTAREEKVLLIAKQSDDETDIVGAIKQVVNNCIVTEGFDIDKLTIFDLEFLFIAIRIKSVSNLAPVSYIDGADKQTYDFDVDLEQVKVIWPVEKPPTISLGEGMSMVMRWPESNLYSDLQLLHSEGPEALERIVAKCISKIYAGDQSYDPDTYTTDEVVNFVNDIDSKAFEEVRNFFENMPRLQYVIEYQNTVGDSRKIELSALTDFFQFR